MKFIFQDVQFSLIYKEEKRHFLKKLLFSGTILSMMHIIKKKVRLMTIKATRTELQKSYLRLTSRKKKSE